VTDWQTDWQVFWIVAPKVLLIYGLPLYLGVAFHKNPQTQESENMPREIKTALNMVTNGEWEQIATKLKHRR
jgi:hypothetical protein